MKSSYSMSSPSIWLSRLMAFSFLAAAPLAHAQSGPNAEQIATCKQATAIVLDAEQGAIGAAVCVDSHGYFLTSAYLLPAAAREAALVIAPTGQRSGVTKARVVRRSLVADLALLQVESEKEFSSLRIGGMDVPEQTAFGFAETGEPPTWSALKNSTVRVNSPQKLDNGVLHMRLVSKLPAQYAGGPLLNAKGEITGLVEGRPEAPAVPDNRSKTIQSGYAWATPSQVIQEFLQQPTIEVTRAELASSAGILEFNVLAEEPFRNPRWIPEVKSSRLGVAISLRNLSEGKYRAQLSLPTDQQSKLTRAPPIAESYAGHFQPQHFGHDLRQLPFALDIEQNDGLIGRFDRPCRSHDWNDLHQVLIRLPIARDALRFQDARLLQFLRRLPGQLVAAFNPKPSLRAGQGAHRLHALLSRD
jgi:hypothetical protein